ncbi:MAG: hypothetical protein GY810_08165 [Aureispira sp.]|nr:hypothetical protein [Aureispira sp.]
MNKIVISLIIVIFIISKTSYAQNIAEVKIVSWNIQMLPNFFGGLSSALRKKQAVRLPWIVEHAKQQDYDVIIFQEVFDIEMKRKLKRGLKEAYPYHVSTKTKSGKFTSNGIYIVSRLPMEYIDHVIYKEGLSEDKLAAKGCTLVEVKKDDLVFHVAGTHLQSGNGDAQLVRNHQYVDMYNLIEKYAQDNIPQFVVGDMNTPKSDTKSYEYMLHAIGVQDFPLDEDRPYTIDSDNSWNDHAEGVQLDYIMLNPRKTTTTISLQKILRPKDTYKEKSMDLADHYGVVTTAKLSNSQ